MRGVAIIVWEDFGKRGYEGMTKENISKLIWSMVKNLPLSIFREQSAIGNFRFFVKWMNWNFSFKIQNQNQMSKLIEMNLISLFQWLIMSQEVIWFSTKRFSKLWVYHQGSNLKFINMDLIFETLLTFSYILGSVTTRKMLR